MHSEKRELAALRRRFSFRFEMIPPERKNIGRTESARPMPPYIIINLYANLPKKDFGFSTQNFHDETNIETKIQITKFSTVYLQIKDYFIRFRDELPFETANPRPPSRKIAAGLGNRNEIVNFEPRQRPTTEQAAYSRSGPNRNAPRRLCGARSSRCRRGRKTYMQNQIPCSTNRSLTKASSCAWKPPSPNDSLRPLLLRAIASAPSRRATNAIGLASKPRSESSPTKRRRAYFERVYLPEAALQCLFVVTEQDEPVATATTWTEEEASLRQLQLQWVAVEPAHQGRGLGRAIATAAVRRAVRLAPGEAILLHTQTWSHRALRLYRSLGFRFCRTQTIVMRSKEGTGMKRYPNEFEEAMEVLRRTVAPAEIDEWRRTAFR